MSVFALSFAIQTAIGAKPSWWFPVGYVLGVAVAVGSWRLARRSRWIRWNVLCLRGRHCANLVVDAVTVPGDPVLHIEYVCGNCGTKYAWDSLTRERVRMTT